MAEAFFKSNLITREGELTLTKQNTYVTTLTVLLSEVVYVVKNRNIF